MHETDLVLFAVLAAVGVLVLIAQASRLPYPITLVVGGIGLGFVPGVPHLALDPNLVFLIFLPPLLYSSASSPRCATSARTCARSRCSRSASPSPRPAPSPSPRMR